MICITFSKYFHIKYFLLLKTHIKVESWNACFNTKSLSSLKNSNFYFHFFLILLSSFWNAGLGSLGKKPNKENSLNPASILQPLIFSHQTREVIKQSRRGSGQRGEDGVWENTARRIQVSWQCRHFHGRLHLSCSGSHAALAAYNTQRTGLNFQMTKKNSGGRNLTLWKRHLYFNLQLIEEIALLHWERKKKKVMNSEIKSPPDLVHA